MSLTTSRKIKISFLILLCILLNFSSGCGRPFIKSEKYKAWKNEDTKKRFFKKHKKLTAKLKIIDGRLDDAAAQILIFTAKQSNKGRILSIDARKLNNEYIKKVADAENETKYLRKKYSALENELKEIEQNIKDLDYPIEKP